MNLKYLPKFTKVSNIYDDNTGAILIMGHSDNTMDFSRLLMADDGALILSDDGQLIEID